MSSKASDKELKEHPFECIERTLNKFGIPSGFDYLCSTMTDKGFTIGVSSTYEGWWRYNVALMCGCFDEKDARTAFVTAQSHIADVGQNLPEAPTETSPVRRVELRTPECDHLVLYLYIIPHTLPTGNDIASTLPFEVEITISHNGKKLRSEKRPINQWSGASIEMRIESE